LKKNKLIKMAQKTTCQTPDAVYSIALKTNSIEVSVKLPKKLSLTKKQAKLLEKNIHNVMEIVLANHFF